MRDARCVVREASRRCLTHHFEELMRRFVGTLAATFVIILTCAAPSAFGQQATANGGRGRAVKLKRVEALIHAANLAGAESELAALLGQDAADGEALNLLGIVRARQLRAAEAEALFKQSLAAAPRLAGPRLNLGLLYAAQNRLEEAAAQFEETLKLAPRHREAAARLVTTLRSLAAEAYAGDPEKALSHLLRAKALAPSEPELLFEFAMAALRLTLHADAATALTAALARRPNEPKYIYALARARMATGDLSAAEKLLRRYTALRPEDASGHFGLGYVLAGLKRRAEARGAFERSLALRPAQTEAPYQLALLAYDEGKVDEAARWFERVLARYADHTGALVGLGQVYFSRRQHDLARQTLERAVALDASLVKAHYQLGLTYARLGEKEAAARELEIAAQLEREQKQQRRVELRLLEQ
jgi:tetratricopeptide (TPR) repeat protein